MKRIIVITMLFISGIILGQDINGWNKASFGSTTVQLSSDFPNAVEITPEVYAGGTYVSLIIPKFTISQIDFKVSFQMNQFDRLEGILFKTEGVTLHDFTSISNLLIEKYGQPKIKNDTEMIWLFTSTKISINFNNYFKMLMIRYSIPVNSESSKF